MFHSLKPEIGLVTLILWSETRFEGLDVWSLSNRLMIFNMLERRGIYAIRCSH